MSHKQLYTKVFHLNRASMAEMGIEPIIIRTLLDPGDGLNSFFNSILKLDLGNGPKNFESFLPKHAEVVSMTATNKYFFTYANEGYIILPVTYEPFFVNNISAYGYGGGPTSVKFLNILIKGPSVEQIPNEKNLYSSLKASTVQGMGFIHGETFQLDHLFCIDLIVNYTLPD